MTHQKHIAAVITNILALSDNVISSFCRGNPFDKLLRSYDEFTSGGKPLYRRPLGRHHYRFSCAAYASGLCPSDKRLFGEHKIPLTVIIQRLINSDRSLSTVEEILQSNEVVIITREEQQYLDGGGLRSRMPPNGKCRLAYAHIEIAPETLSNHL
jgi:hypothetical protein